MYDDIFALNTQGQDYTRSLVVKALNWVLCSFKPLTLDGFVEAVALDATGARDPIVDQAFLLQICSNLIRVNNAGDIRFAHRSVKEYLARGIALPKLNRHHQAAETCFAFLLSLENESVFASLLSSSQHDSESLHLSDFEMYACLLWASHCEKAQTSKALQSLLWKFLITTAGRKASVSFTKWNNLLWRIYHTDYTIDSQLRQRLEDAISVPANPLLAACIWGFCDVALRCVSQDPSLIDHANHRGKSPLFLACENGHTDIVNQLVRYKAPVNAFHPIWGSCLQGAAWAGSLQSFQLLLSRGASINMNGGCYGRVLDAAMTGGNESVVAAALRGGAEVWLAATPRQIPSLGKDWGPLIPVKKKVLGNRISEFERWVRKSRQPSDVRNLDNTRSEGQLSFINRIYLANARRSQLLLFLELYGKRPSNDPSFACITPLNRGSDIPSLLQAESMIQDMSNSAAPTPRQYNLFRKASFHPDCCFKLSGLDFEAMWRYESSIPLQAELHGVQY